MIRSKFFSRFIVVTLTAALLLVSGSRAIRVSALAVGPLADPVYDTEILAFKEYVEQNLSEPQLDIMFFLVGGLAVAQMGAQDAQLVSPYPVEHNVKEWIINCGIQLYNSVIGLVPEGDYYIGIPLIGNETRVKGIPRETIKSLVAQMMGDAVVAANYRDLDNFLEENPDEIYLPINRELQIGVNSVFGVLGGLNSWQRSTDINASFSWRTVNMDSTTQDAYNSYRNTYFEYPTAANGDRRIVNNSYWPNYFLNGLIDLDINLFNRFHNIFINPGSNSYSFLDDNGININNYLTFPIDVMTVIDTGDSVASRTFTSYSSDVMSYSSSYSKEDVIRNIYNGTLPYFKFYALSSTNVWISTPALLAAGVDFDFYYGTDWAHRIQFDVYTDLNLDDNDMSAYYNQLTTDYLFDLRGLMGDLVNYVYLNRIWDNIYDLVGNLVVPDRVKVSVDLTPITDLLAPPVPVNLNDIAELTDNSYLERVKEHARNAGDIFANYVAFWHNCDSDLVYTIFGAAILVLVGAFVGKWGHS